MDGSDAPVTEGMPRAATAIAVVAWGTAVLAVVLTVAARAPVDEALWFFAVDVTVACVYGTVAPVILARRRHPVPWILAFAAVGGGLAALGFAYKTFALERAGLPAVEAIGMLQGLAWVPGTLALFLVVPWLVRDHPLGRAVWGVVAGSALIAVFVVCQVVGVDVLFTGLVTAVVVLGLVTAAAVEWRHRRGPVAERNGLGWLALGTAVLALSFVPLALPWGLVSFPVWVTPVLHLASQAVYPAAVLVAVLRGRMWGLQLAISRTVLAGLMTVTLTTTYVVVTWLVTRVVPGSGFGQLVGAAGRRGGRAAGPAVAGAAGAPARARHRRDPRPRRAPARAATCASRARPRAAARPGRGRRHRHAAGVGRPRPCPVATTSSGACPPGRPSPSPCATAARRSGRWSSRCPAASRSARPGSAPSSDLANVVATAVAVTRAAREVEEARQRLASARLAERRVIRREIHDGLGPSLAGLRLGLRGARNLLDTDPAAAAELLATLQDELDQRVAEVRTLSHSLLPPVLDELGLGAALSELAARYAEDGLTVRLDLHHEEVADPQVAAAAYGIIGEALVNVSRHSGGERVHRAHRVVGRLAHGAGLGCRARHRRGRARRASAAGRCASGPRSRAAGSRSTRPPAPGRPSRPCSRWRWPAVPEQPASTAPIRVAIVDDHPVFRLGMAGLLGSLDGISVVAQASDAQQALAIAPGSVDVVLMDLHLGEDSGIETTRELVRRDPDVRVLVVTMREDDESVVASHAGGGPRLPAQGRVAGGGRAGGAGGRQRRGHPRPRGRRPGGRGAHRRPHRGPGALPRAHRPRARGARPRRPRLRQPHHRAAAGAQPEDGAQQRLERADQARRPRPLGGDRPGARGGASASTDGPLASTARRSATVGRLVSARPSARSSF